MNKLEVFFDYACPYCLRAHGYLVELSKLYPEINVVWRPCEAHPRPDRYGPHSDLCIQGMFYALEHEADILAYHEIMYRAALKDRINVEDINVLSKAASALFDRDDFYHAIKTGRYEKEQKEANRYAYMQTGIMVVPSYRMNGGELNSAEDIGVTKERLRDFIERYKTLT